MELRFFDAHCHLDLMLSHDAAASESAASGLGLFDCGIDPRDFSTANERARRQPGIIAGVGLHPWWLADGRCGPAEVNLFCEVAAQERYIGEIGLDYYWEQNPPREFQQEVFRDQLALAQELGLPVIVHDRDAHADCLAIVKEFPQVRGVFHCFSGSVEIAQELIKRGWYLGFDGPLTYKNAKKTLEVAKVVPLDRVLLETDSPYMSPVPVRGTRNDSRNVSHIAAKFAEIRGMSTDEIIALTNENGRRFFGIQSVKEERS